MQMYHNFAINRWKIMFQQTSNAKKKYDLYVLWIIITGIYSNKQKNQQLSILLAS